MVSIAIARDLKLALDPIAFASESLSFTPDLWQGSVLRSPSKQLLLCCARQTGKSTTASALALHQALYLPKTLTLLLSPSLRQSAELFRKVTEMLERLVVKPRLLEDNKLSLQLENKSRIVSLPSSEGTIRGFSGATLIIEDEAARVSDDLYRAVRPMLAVSGGRLILMSTPFGKRGHFFEEWANDGPAWERIKITAYDCPRISPDFLEREKVSMGDWWFRQEYGCEFVESTDQVFGYDLVMNAVSKDIKPLFGESI